MSAARRPAVLGRHARIGIDSSVLIYLLERSGPLAGTAGALLDNIAAGDVQGFRIKPLPRLEVFYLDELRRSLTRRSPELARRAAGALRCV